MSNILDNRKWIVRTEGDSEGRSLKDIGVFESDILSILLSLAKKRTYTLHLSVADDISIPQELPVLGENVPQIYIRFYIEGMRDELVAEHLSEKYPSEKFSKGNYGVDFWINEKTITRCKMNKSFD